MRQRELAEKCAVSESLISLILSGARRPSWDLAVMLGVETRTATTFWMEATPEEKKMVLRFAGKRGGDK
jgi:transcriptional regulator with XRE-family HTH domain